MKDLFALDPNVVFLNHGSFGAAPRSVLDTYQEWQYRLERQHVQFIVREMQAELAKARKELGKYLNASVSAMEDYCSAVM